MNMKKTSIVIGVSLLALTAGLASCRGGSSSEAYETILGLFRQPPSEYRSAPLWVWNDRMTKEEIRSALADFKERGIGGAFIHPRPGLITPYLSEEWLSLCRYAVETGKSLGLKIWIYDENSYPSGFAGGHVPAQMPEAARSGLRLTRIQGPPRASNRTPLVVLRQALSRFEDVTGKVGPDPRDNALYYVFDVVRQEPSPWYGGFTYVDLMRKGVTERFLDITHNAYKQVIGAEFGQTVPGAFQDEAEIGPPDGILHQI